MTRFPTWLPLALAAALLPAGTLAAADAAGELNWQPAPTAAVAPNPGDETPDTPLEDIAAAIRKAPVAMQKAPPPVVEAEMFPLPYRPILRRYFDAARP